MIALRGNLYHGSITAVSGSSGTLVRDIEARVIPFEVGLGGRLMSAGIARDKMKVLDGGDERFAIDVRFRDFSASGLALAMAPYELDSGGFAPDGTGAATRMAIRSGASMIVRPVDSSGLYLYVKSAALMTPRMIAQYSDELPALDAQTVRFMATRSGTDSEPAWFIGTPAQIAGAYAGLEAS